MVSWIGHGLPVCFFSALVDMRGGESGAKDNSGVLYAAFDVLHFLEADMFS